MKSPRNMPLGIQSFREIRKAEYGYVYVDKSKFIAKLARTSWPYFLSRPRRFGKSLFLSMLRSYFLGEKELFKGLEIEKIKSDEGSDWKTYPVLYLDLSGQAYIEKDALNDILKTNIERWKKEYEVKCEENSPSLAFSTIVQEIYKQTGDPVVILVDEYDAPLLSTLNNTELNDHYRAILKGFYTVLKSCGEYIRFSFLTGVSKFSSLTIFSGLNNLVDISMLDEYSEICGLTENEILTYFSEELNEFAIANNTTTEVAIASLKKHYDGYHFSKNSKDIYNPFSLCNALATKEISDYWFRTGTPTFLVEFIAKNCVNMPSLDSGDIMLKAKHLADYRANGDDIVPLLFQAGYLTIKEYIQDGNYYVLGYPNDEVRYAFVNSLFEEYTRSIPSVHSHFSIISFAQLMKKGDIEGILQRINSLLESLPYDSLKKDKIPLREYNIQTTVYLIFTLMGEDVRCEVHSLYGRSDIEVETNDGVFIFEFKMQGEASDALAQIEKQGYAKKYAGCGKPITLIGISVTEDAKMLKEWLIKEM